jgi:hypothetical protein
MSYQPASLKTKLCVDNPGNTVHLSTQISTPNLTQLNTWASLVSN